MIKYLKYLRYVLIHKYYVFMECYKMGLIWRGIIHDWHKFLPSEFIPYARYFYGNYPSNNDLTSGEKWRFPLTKEQVKIDFDLSWLYHQRMAKHHWQWWVMIDEGEDSETKVFRMPDVYMKEMLADWIGAGVAITGERKTKEWYEKNKDKMFLHKDTRKWIEEQLNI